MSWTAPRTWPAASIITAAQLNAHIRDNLLETMTAKVTAAGDIAYATGAHALARIGLGEVAGNVGNPKTVLKTADTARNTTTTLADDTGLVFPVGANETWVFDAVVYYDGPAAADFKGGWYGPTGVTGSQVATYMGLNPLGYLIGTNPLTTSAPSVVAECDAAGITILFRMVWHVNVVNGANAGNITFQWAQNTSNAGTTTVRKGSYIRGYKVA